MITLEGKSRRQRRNIMNEAHRAEKRKLLSVGVEFEHVVVRAHDKPYREVYNRFLEAYVNTAKQFNSRTRHADIDLHWFRNTYRHNWRLRWRRFVQRIKVRARFNPLPA